MSGKNAFFTAVIALVIAVGYDKYKMRSGG